MNKSLCGLLLGDFSQPELEAIRQLCERDALVHHAPSVAAGIELIQKTGLRPDIVLLARVQPGTTWDETSLRRLLPQTPLVTVLGSWCGREPRTGEAERICISWHQFEPEWSYFVAQKTAPRRWGLPVVWESLVGQGRGAREKVVVAARHFDAAEPLIEACAVRGLTGVWTPPGQPVSPEGVCMGIWSGAGFGAREQSELADFRKQLRPLSVLVLVDFPRLETCRKACSGGAVTVLGKPFLLEHFYGALDRILAIAPARP